MEEINDPNGQSFGNILSIGVRMTAIPENNSPPSEAFPNTHDFIFMA